ncbi:MAG: hypothetical protein COA79_23370 [Planctomycetota bacterium]|nr:MAG: hypothetical protein COA79_23370 [Planctomycetota bacterium]
MTSIKLAPLSKIKQISIENKNVSIGVDQKTGFIRSIQFKKQKIDLFQQIKQDIPGYAGALRIYDELDEKWYSSLNDVFTIKNFRKNKNQITFEQIFKGCPFKLKIKLQLDKEFFHWEVNANKNNKNVANRSLRVIFDMPLIAGWNIWAPCHEGDFTFDGMTSFDFNHIQVPYVSPKDIILPMVTHYDKNQDIGFSIVEPIDARTPASRFQFNNSEKNYNWGSMEKDLRSVPTLETMNFYIGLVDNREMKTKINMLFHEGDWRPALGQVFNKWKEFFIPYCDTIYKYEGVFTCEGVQTANDIKRCKDFNIKTLEIHGHFEHYSDYFQDGKDQWYKLQIKEGYYHKNGKKQTGKEIQDFFDTHTADEILDEMKDFLAGPNKGIDQNLLAGEKKSAKLTTDDLIHKRKDIKKALKKLSDSGIGLYWYFNYTDGFRPIVEKKFQNSIAKNEDGSDQASGWHSCHNMNVDPKFSFGKFTIESAKKIFKEYPYLNGFFLDCFRHFEIDFGHDDGVTVVHNKPAYSMNFSYDAIEKEIKTKIMKKRKLASFANKPQSIRSLRYVDGVLLEGDGNVAEGKYFWTCIAKPLFFMWTSNKKENEFNLKRSVLYGSFPKFALDNNDYKASKKLYDDFMPLFKQFPRRVFCFEADPVRVPNSSRAMLFTVGKNYVAGVINENINMNDKIIYGKTPYATFRVKKAHDITKVTIIYPGDKKPAKTKFKFDGTFIYVPMKDYKNCAVIKLHVTKKSGKKIGTQKFTEGVDFCGDPESSYDATNKR